MQGGDAIGGGIIPARAGFTQGRLDWRPLPRDHPRSRGVYPRPRWGGLRKSGSSPLARGLPDGVVVQGGPEGIIPARAGFTSRWSDAVRRRPDHPRSRGVYSVSFDSVIVLTGSSPLARGLLRWCGGPGRPRRDHPRSRGVYARAARRRHRRAGSSPLARGLPRPRGAVARRFRIIPARAGFTGGLGRPRSCPRDHPRSRGVYAVSAAPPNAAKGSSPLARGLRRTKTLEDFRTRIIPARAGFTCGRCRCGPGSGDHPRSRGVYQARRLPATAIGRIIPARAGFTRTAGRGGRSMSDHPRSRGVYNPPTETRLYQVGSSPLARGLLPSRPDACPSTGIIPARAGFTSGAR